MSTAARPSSSVSSEAEPPRLRTAVHESSDSNSNSNDNDNDNNDDNDDDNNDDSNHDNNTNSINSNRDYMYTHGSFLIRRQRGHPSVVLPLVVSKSANR